MIIYLKILYSLQQNGLLKAHNIIYHKTTIHKITSIKLKIIFFFAPINFVVSNPNKIQGQLKILEFYIISKSIIYNILGTILFHI